MFTGLIEEIGKIASVARSGDGFLLKINAERVLEGTAVGDSISINGACQTVTARDDRSFTVFVSAVTAGITTLGGFTVGRRVNLERAMTPASRFGGHFVQGHVDGRAKIGQIEKSPSGERAVLTLPSDLRKYVVEKGSIAADGVSLTVVSVTENGFVLYFIPETLGNTVVSEWKTGDEVNIEVDIIAKYVEKMLYSPKSDGGTDGRGLLKKLVEEGFA
jgi:riboflavin synthase